MLKRFPLAVVAAVMMYATHDSSPHARADRVVRGDMASSVGCPVVCGAAETAVLADRVVLDEFSCTSGAGRLILQLSSERVCCFVVSLVSCARPPTTGQVRRPP